MHTKISNNSPNQSNSYLEQIRIKKLHILLAVCFPHQGARISLGTVMSIRQHPKFSSTDLAILILTLFYRCFQRKCALAKEQEKYVKTRCAVINKCCETLKLNSTFDEVPLIHVGFILAINPLRKLTENGKFEVCELTYFYSLLLRVLCRPSSSMNHLSFKRFAAAIEKTMQSIKSAEAGKPGQPKDLFKTELYLVRQLNFFLTPCGGKETEHLGAIIGRESHNPLIAEENRVKGATELISAINYLFLHVLVVCRSINYYCQDLEITFENAINEGTLEVDPQINKKYELWKESHRSIFNILLIRSQLISHHLSDFRNYIHEYGCMEEERFTYYKNFLEDNINLLQKSARDFNDLTKKFVCSLFAISEQDYLAYKTKRTDINLAIKYPETVAFNDLDALEESEELHLGNAGTDTESASYQSKLDISATFIECTILMSSVIDGFNICRIIYRDLNSQIKPLLDKRFKEKMGTSDLQLLTQAKFYPALDKRVGRNKQNGPAKTAPVSTPLPKSKAETKNIKRPKKTAHNTLHPKRSPKQNKSYMNLIDGICSRLFPSSKTREASKDHLCSKNAVFHLQVLGATIDLLKKMPNEKAILFRLVRNSSLAIEQMATSLHFKQTGSLLLQHDFYSLLENTEGWEALPNELQPHLLSLNLGAIFHRYPHNAAHFLESKHLPIPQFLYCLAGKEQSADLPSLSAIALSCLGHFWNDKGCLTLGRRIQKDLASVKSEKEKEKETCHPFTQTLKEILAPAFELAETTMDKLHAISTMTNLTKKQQTNLLDIIYHINGLREDMALWIQTPDIQFFLSHLDAILTRLQFADELIEETLHQHIFGFELQTHDLQYYRDLRYCSLNSEDADTLSSLNIHIWSQYPYQGKQEIKEYNKVHPEEPATHLPNGVSWRLKAIKLAKFAADYKAGFTPVTKERNAKNAIDPEQFQKDLVQLILNFLKMAEGNLQQMLAGSA